MTIYVHRYFTQTDLWGVGYYHSKTGTGEITFRVLRDCGSPEEAAAFLNFLNGGDGKPFTWDGAT